MKRNSFLHAAPLILLAGLPSLANICITDSSGSIGSTSTILPSFIGGPEKSRTKFTFQMNCDTMVVPSGDTTTIATNTLLYFPEKQLPNRIILVEGTLKIQGKSKHSVVLAGSKAVSQLGGAVPGDEKWGGIRVSESGALFIEHADFFNADTAFRSHSSRLSMDLGYFSDCDVFILSDGTIKKLGNGQYQTVKGMNSLLLAPKPLPTEPEKKAEKASGNKTNLWRWAGGIIGAGGFIGILAWQPWKDESTPSQPTPQGGSPFKPLPAPPGKVDPL